MTSAAAAVAAWLSAKFEVRSQVFAGATRLAYHPMAIATAFPYLLPTAP